MIIHPELKKEKKNIVKTRCEEKIGDWLRCLKKVNNKYRSHWCKRKKKIVTKLRTGHARCSAAWKQNNFFSPKCSLFVAYILRLRPPFSRQVSTCLMLYWCPAIGRTTTKILWWIFFFFKSRKKCCQNTNKTKQKLFIKKNMGSTSHYLNN